MDTHRMDILPVDPRLGITRYRKAQAHRTGWRVRGPIHLVRKLSLPIPVAAIVCAIQARGKASDYHYTGNDPLRSFWFLYIITLPPCGIYLIYNMVYLITLRPSLKSAAAVVKKVQDSVEGFIVLSTAVCMALAAARLAKSESNPFHAAVVALLAVQMVVAAVIWTLRIFKGMQF